MQNSDVNLYYDQVQSIFFLENLDVLLRGLHFKNEACFLYTLCRYSFATSVPCTHSDELYSGEKIE